MAKKSAVELALEAIDAKIAPLNAELHALQLARLALIDAGELGDANEAAKPKAKRARKRRGAPTGGDVADESTRMHV